MDGVGTEDRLRTLVWRVAQINKVYYLVLVLISGVGFLHFASTRRKADAASAAGMLPFWLNALFTGVDLVCFSGPPVQFPPVPGGGKVRAWVRRLRLGRPAGSCELSRALLPIG